MVAFYGFLLDDNVFHLFPGLGARSSWCWMMRLRKIQRVRGGGSTLLLGGLRGGDGSMLFSSWLLLNSIWKRICEIDVEFGRGKPHIEHLDEGLRGRQPLTNVS